MPGEQAAPPKPDADERQLLARAVGARIRTRRHELGLTLQQLAAATDLSHPFLSQVERGLARPSFGSLQGIAAALKLSPSALLGSVSAPAVQVFRAAEADEYPQPTGIDGFIRPLIPPGTGLQLLESVGGPRQYVGADTTMSAQALIYVLRGRIEVRAEGGTNELDIGDAVVIDVGIPHNIRITGPRSSSFLYLALSPPLPDAAAPTSANDGT
jgi:transcriptional regulator with XRE-family HTH domain